MESQYGSTFYQDPFALSNVPPQADDATTYLDELNKLSMNLLGYNAPQDMKEIDLLPQDDVFQLLNYDATAAGYTFDQYTSPPNAQDFNDTSASNMNGSFNPLTTLPQEEGLDTDMFQTTEALAGDNNRSQFSTSNGFSSYIAIDTSNLSAASSRPYTPEHSTTPLQSTTHTPSQIPAYLNVNSPSVVGTPGSPYHQDYNAPLLCPPQPSSSLSFDIVPSPRGDGGFYRSNSGASQQSGVSGQYSEIILPSAVDGSGDCAIEDEMEVVDDQCYGQHDHDYHQLFPEINNAQPAISSASTAANIFPSMGGLDLMDNLGMISDDLNHNHTRLQPRRKPSSGPWNAANPQVSNFPSSYPMLLPPPGPVAERIIKEEEMNMLGVATCELPPKASPAHKPRGLTKRGIAKLKNAKVNMMAKRREPEKNYRFQVTMAGANGPSTISDEGEKTSKRPGVRSGKLDPGTRAKAREIRQLGACWECWTQKVPCSKDEVCARCLKRAMVDGLVCYRSGFETFGLAFFPGYLHEHLSQNSVQKLVDENVRWTNISFQVEISTGSIFKPMVLAAFQFIPRSRELLTQTRLATAAEMSDSEIVTQTSVPLGLLGLDSQDLMATCKGHIEEMITNREYPAFCTAGDPSELPCQILGIVQRYCDEQDIPLLRNAMKLHAMHFFMGVVPTFSPNSASQIYSALQMTTGPGWFPSSRLLNRQLKAWMHELHKTTTEQVLKDLERSIKRRTPDSWGPAFCAILVLCLCIDSLQIAADIFVITDMQEKGESSRYRRAQSKDACDNLENFPFKRLKRLFHEIYKSHKEANGKDAGWNPLRLIEDGAPTKLDPATNRMANSVYQMINANWDNITVLAANPITSDVDTISPMKIKENSCGRLAAVFLKSFFPKRP